MTSFEQKILRLVFRPVLVYTLTMETGRTFHPTSRQEWREWLERNHAIEKEVWLIHYKKASGKPTITHSEALDEALCFGWIDGQTKSLDGERFTFRYTPRLPGSRWSKVNKDRAEKLIKEGRMAPSGMAKIEEAKKSGAWDNAYSIKRINEVPPDLQAAMATNPEALNFFESLAPGARNNYLRWVEDAKRVETRSRRIAEVVRLCSLKIKPGINTPFFKSIDVNADKTGNRK